MEFLNTAFETKTHTRSLKAIASDIRYAFKSERQDKLKIGRFLREAEIKIEHGTYEAWIIEQQFGFDLRTARRYRALLAGVERLGETGVTEAQLSMLPNKTICSIGQADDKPFAVVVELFKNNATPTKDAISNALSAAATAIKTKVDASQSETDADAESDDEPKVVVLKSTASTKALIAAENAAALLQLQLHSSDLAKFKKLYSAADTDAFAAALFAVKKSEAA